jgi:hypothetical protein
MDSAIRFTVNLLPYFALVMLWISVGSLPYLFACAFAEQYRADTDSPPDALFAFSLSVTAALLSGILLIVSK